MRLVLLFTIWFSTTSIISMQTVRPIFGVKVSVGPNSEVTSYACYLYNGRALVKGRIVDRTTFLKIITGYWPSIYNPKRIDYMKENGVDYILEKDPATHIETVDCEAFNRFWKIRYSLYPFTHITEPGWSNKYHKPSPGQEIYIAERYNVKHLDGDFFLDTNFWQLAHDVMDEGWIENYRKIQ